MRWRIASDIREIEHVVSAVTGACINAGFSESACRLNVPVALTEAIANAIEKGNGGDVNREVKVYARIEDGCLCVDVTDEGSGFDLEAVRALEEQADWIEREDGRGVFLMYALMDEVEMWRDSGHTVRLILRKK